MRCDVGDLSDLDATFATSATNVEGVLFGAQEGVRDLARGWTLDAQENGFRVDVLSPGPTRTPGLLGIVPEDQQDDFAEALAAALPAGRLGDPDEIAAAALLLASDAAAFVNGAEWFVDGGRTSA